MKVKFQPVSNVLLMIIELNILVFSIIILLALIPVYRHIAQWEAVRTGLMREITASERETEYHLHSSYGD